MTPLANLALVYAKHRMKNFPYNVWFNPYNPVRMIVTPSSIDGDQLEAPVAKPKAEPHFARLQSLCFLLHCSVSSNTKTLGRIWNTETQKATERSKINGQEDDKQSRGEEGKGCEEEALCWQSVTIPVSPLMAYWGVGLVNKAFVTSWYESSLWYFQFLFITFLVIISF